MSSVKIYNPGYNWDLGPGATIKVNEDGIYVELSSGEYATKTISFFSNKMAPTAFTHTITVFNPATTDSSVRITTNNILPCEATSQFSDTLSAGDEKMYTLSGYVLTQTASIKIESTGGTIGVKFIDEYIS